jgi:hypothetical protein
MRASSIGSPSAHMLRPDQLIMAIIFAGAVIAGGAMLPGESERIAMLERDGHSREALAILEQKVSAGDQRYRTLHQILALYENEGNVQKAQVTLESMARQRPRDAAVKRRLAQFYRNNQNDEAYIATLNDLMNLRYSESVCRELIGRLRFKGDHAGEFAVLQKCRQKGYRRAEDLSRLAELAAVEGDLTQAVGLLKSIDDLKRLKTTRERYQLLQLLIDQDQPREAERRALRWIRAARDDDVAIGFIDILARSKYPGTAIEVAKDAGAPGDSISLTVAERLIEKTQNGAAQLYLRGWLDHAKEVSDETAARFIEVAIGAGDALIAYRGARQFGIARLPLSSIQSLALALDRAGAKAEAADVRAAATAAGPELAKGAADPSLQDALQKSAGGTVAKGAVDSSGRLRQVVLVDPLDQWRRSLYSSMANDATKRMQALFVGPKPPAGVSGAVNGRPEGRSGGARFLKKTSKVLLRSKKLTSLKAKRRSAKPAVSAPVPPKSGAPSEP